MPKGQRGASIQLQSVSLQYGNSEFTTQSSSGLILDHLSLSIQEGEFVSILGPSGCGKSTLLRLLADLEYPSSGNISFKSIPEPIIRGIVFQEPCLLPWRTVLQNVSLPLELQGKAKEFSQQKAIQALDRVGLKNALEKYPSQLSGGMKMRVSVARALVFWPHLLLLDEPFSALDENTRQSLQEELRGLWEISGLTVIFVTHSLSEAIYLSNRVILFSDLPARILLDEKIQLPTSRPSEIRMWPQFNEELKKFNHLLNPKRELWKI